MRLLCEHLAQQQRAMFFNKHNYNLNDLLDKKYVSIRMVSYHQEDDKTSKYFVILPLLYRRSENVIYVNIQYITKRL